MTTTCTSTGLARRLPLELERYTFELAADIHSKCIPALLRVAHRVRIWIEPLLYTVLCLDNARIRRFLKTTQSKPAPFLTSTVRHVLLYSSMDTLDPDAIVTFLECCPGIVDLSLVSSIGGSRIRDALGAMRIQRLSIDMLDLFSDEDGDAYEPNIDLTHPLFRAVTHLDLFDDISVDGDEWLQQLSTLPALSCLHVNGGAHPAVLRDILADCPSLAVLLVAFHQSEASIARMFILEADFTDARMVVGLYYLDYSTEWELGARGGDDLWVHAERFVARKKQGEIKAHEYFMNVEGDVVPLADLPDSGEGSSDEEASDDEDFDEEESTDEETD
ncbi:hypothetical protein C8R43DRAFT_1162507 [Mycena crocata]|nr:hypothetical protein C8R43DRAFT_1162507 [Mycena crocata]